MAAVFDLDRAQRDRAAQMVDVGLTAIEKAIGSLAPKTAVAELARARGFLAGLETNILAGAVTADGTTNGAEKLAGNNKT